MTYDTIERSEAQARPVELFTFSRGTVAWRFTSADRDRSVGGDAFVAATIIRGGISQGSELNRSALTLKVPREFPIAQMFAQGVPVDTIVLRVQQYHEGDDQVAGVWGGRVVNVAFTSEGAEIACEPVYTSVRAMGLRRRYQRQCPHALYGKGCEVDPAAFVLVSEVSAVEGNAITAPGLDAHPDGWWEGGYLQYEIEPGVVERRFIFGHTGETVTTLTRPAGLLPDMEVQFFPGCDHSESTCASKFANLLNYGGMPDIPLKNPFGNSPIY